MHFKIIITFATIIAIRVAATAIETQDHGLASEYLCNFDLGSRIFC